MTESRILEEYQDKLLRKQQGIEEDSDNDDELLELLEEDTEFDQYRERRIQELSEQFKTAKQNVRDGYGSVETLLSEEQVLQKTTSIKHVVIHFFHPNFQKCKFLDDKLVTLAQKNLSTKFLRVNVEDAPFLVTRLKIKVLPVLILYINGVEANRVVGFEKLNYNKDSETFTIESLENFLLENGVIQRKANKYTRISKIDANNETDESDLDL